MTGQLPVPGQLPVTLCGVVGWVTGWLPVTMCDGGVSCDCMCVEWRSGGGSYL